MSEPSSELLKHLAAQYEILEKLGEGGMGTLYKIRHRLLGELRVAKMMRAALRDDVDLVARFQREARLASQLRHPQVAQLYDFTIDKEGNACILMEFIVGMTLEELLCCGPPPLALTLEIAVQTVQALDYLHRNQFVHRDISPDNLMLSHDIEGRPLIKLIDLGIAKALGEEAARFTATGMFLGKVRYSSPEQLEGASMAQVDGRSDLYSFAVVFFELLTGVYPIRGSSPPSWIAGHLYQPPLEFAQTGAGSQVPAALQELTLQALSKRPEERPATAADFCHRLDEIRASFPLTRELEEQVFELVTAPRPAPGKPRAIVPWARFAGESQSTTRTDAPGKRMTTPAPWRVSSGLATQGPTEIAPGSGGRQLSERERAARREAARQKRRDNIEKAGARIEAEIDAGRLTRADQRLDKALATHGDDPAWESLRQRLEDRRRQRDASAEHLRQAEKALKSRDLDGAAGAVRAALAIDSAGEEALALQQEIEATLAKEEERRADLRQIEALIEDERVEEAESRLKSHEAQRGEVPEALRQKLEQCRHGLLLAELLARAQELIAGQEFERALEPLKLAAQAAPDDGRIRELLQKTRADLEEQGREKARREIAVEIDQFLDADSLQPAQIEDAARRLAAARAEYSDGEPLVEIERRIQRLRRDHQRKAMVAEAESLVASGNFLQALEKFDQALPLADDASSLHRRIAAVQEAHRARQREERLEKEVAREADRLRRLIHAGEHGRARRRLGKGRKKFGQRTEFEVIEQELEERLRQQQRQRQQDETVITPVAPEPPGKELEPTVRIPLPLKPSQPKPGRERSAARFGLRPLGYLLLALGCGVLALWLGWRPEPATKSSSTLPSSDMASPSRPERATGQLILTAVPWGELTSLIDAEGKRLDDFLGRQTPSAIEVPAGRYCVRLENPAFNQPVEFEIEVTAGAVARSVRSFQEVSVDAFLSEYGL